VRVVDWERRGSEGGAPRKGWRAVAPAKSRRLTGPRCSGELRGGWPRKTACGNGGSGVDERGKGEMGRDGGRHLFSKKLARWRGPIEGKRGGWHGRVREEAGEGGERGALM
jgi:hypothetical protein